MSRYFARVEDRAVRPFLFLLCALAVPVSLGSGCADDGGGDREQSEDPSTGDDGDDGDDEDEEDELDARVPRRDAALDGSRDGSRGGDDDERGDGGTDAPDAEAEGDAASGDAGRTSDAGVGMDAARPDAGQDEEDAGQFEQDAGQDEQDAGEDDASQPSEGCTNDDGCADGQFCKLPAGSCGAEDSTGVCTDKPTACEADMRPVCGCDDQTFFNQCEADLMGQSIRGPGVCGRQDCTAGGGTVENGDDPTCPEGSEASPILDSDSAICCFPLPSDGAEEGEPCGGEDTISCAVGLYCDTGIADGGSGCGEDAEGTCRALTTDCMDDFFGAVCGCNGMRYWGACRAAEVGVSIDYGNISCLLQP